MNGEGWIGGEYNLRVEAGCFFFLTAGCLTTRVYTARSNGVCVYVCVLGGGGVLTALVCPSSHTYLYCMHLQAVRMHVLYVHVCASKIWSGFGLI